MFVYVLKKRQDGLIAFYREKKENLEFNGFKQHLILHLKEIKQKQLVFRIRRIYFIQLCC
jgi:hypothetical protein